MKHSPLVALLVWCLFSCRTMPAEPDAPLGSYIEKFERRYRAVVDYPVKFRKLEKYAGLCELPPDPVVYIDPRYWRHATRIQRIYIVLHELAHCTWDREHRSDRFENGEPCSLMHPTSAPSAEWFSRNKSYYYQELLNPEATRCRKQKIFRSTGTNIR